MYKLFLVLLFFLSCEKDYKKGNSINEYIDNVIYGEPILIEISKNNEISIKISSDTLYRYNGGNTILFGSVYADLFDDKGVKVAGTRARKALGELTKLAKARRAEIQDKKNNT